MENRLQAKDLLKIRIERFSSNGVSKTTACKYVAKLLKNKWGHKYLYQVAYTDILPGPKLATAILRIPNKVRSPQLWVKLICETQEQKDYILSLPMEERRGRVLGEGWEEGIKNEI